MPDDIWRITQSGGRRRGEAIAPGRHMWRRQQALSNTSTTYVLAALAARKHTVAAAPKSQRAAAGRGRFRLGSLSVGLIFVAMLKGLTTGPDEGYIGLIGKGVLVSYVGRNLIGRCKGLVTGPSERNIVSIGLGLPEGHLGRTAIDRAPSQGRAPVTLMILPTAA